MEKFSLRIKALIPVELKLICKRMLFSWIKSRLDEEEARKILMDYCPKPEGKCYTNNMIDIQYDLQIVIPAYNVEKWIVDCLESVFQQ